MMRRCAALALFGLMANQGMAQETSLRGRQLARGDYKEESMTNKSNATMVFEQRDSLAWTYIPNYNYVCEEVGCCGLPDAKMPDKQPCGPELWRYIDAVSAKRCVSDGKTNQQSPIRIVTEGSEAMTFTPMMDLMKSKGMPKGDVLKPEFKTTRCMGTISFVKNTWELVFPDDCSFYVDLFGERWDLVNYQIHNSEHPVDGMYLPLEAHMTHKNKKNELLILTVFLVAGSTNPWFKSIKYNPGAKGLSVEPKPVSPYDLVPRDQKYWYYEGSLTTPPCQPVDGGAVKWVLFQDPVELSLKRIGLFGSYFADVKKSYSGQVNRPLQPLLTTTKVYEHYTHGRSAPKQEQGKIEIE